MAEPTPGRPGGEASAGEGARSATAATFVVNDSSLKKLHTTWQMLIKDVKEFNAGLLALSSGAKVVEGLSMQLGSIGGRGGTRGGRVAAMPPNPVADTATGGSGANATGGTPALAGGSSPWRRAGGMAAKAGFAAVGGSALFYQSRMADISDSDLFFNQQAQNTGYGYRGAEKSAVRRGMFGAPGTRGGGGLSGYQSVQDAVGGVSTVFGATGGSWGGRGTEQARQAGQLAALNPSAGLQGSANAVASLYDPTQSARFNSLGMGPSVGMGGHLQSPQAIYSNIVQRVFRGRRPTAQMITEGLQPGAPLYATLTMGLGLSPDAIDQFARYAIAQSNLKDPSQVNRAVSAASRAMTGAHLNSGDRALVKQAGLDDSIRAHQNQAGAAGARQTIEAGREAEGALMAGFSTLAHVTDDLTNSFKRLNDMTGGASGNMLGISGMAGGPLQGALNSVGGVGGSIFAAQSLKGLFARGGARGGGLLGRLGIGGGAAAAEEGAAGAGFGGAAVAAGGLGLAGIAAGAGADWLGRKTGHRHTGQIAGDALRGAGIGAAVGSVVPGVGTAIGAGVGAGLGAAWGARSDISRFAKWSMHFAAGGVVPGHHGRDDVSIAATPGEVVVPRNIVSLHGGAGALMKRLGFHGRGSDGHYAGGGEVSGDTQGLNADFLKRLTAWSAYVGQPFVVGSGYRSMAEQKVLYDKWMRRVPGQAMAAKPGSSNHNYGLAADGPRWGGKNPGKFGLVYPMSWEPWHVEPVGARGMRGGHPGSVIDTAASDGVDAGTGGGGGSATGAGNVAQAPGVLANESSVMAAFMAKANAPYGAAQMPSGVTAVPTQASGVAATSARASVAPAPDNATGNVALGKRKAAARGWTGTEWDALYQLWNKESSWRTGASNPTSSARGIAQTMMSVHFGKNWQTDKRAQAFLTNPSEQIDWGLNYISGRYSRPSAAWAHSQQMNWYEKGAWSTEDETARLHRDEMVVPAAQARRLRKLVRDRGAEVQSGGMQMGSSPAKVEVSISMPVQLVGAATQNDAHRLVTMVKHELEQDQTLAMLGSG